VSDAIAVTVDRIQALVDFRRLDEARQLAIKATDDTPEEDALWAALALVERAREDWVASRIASDVALSLNPRSSSALFTRALALSALGKTKQARAGVALLIETYPEWAPSFMLRAYIYSRWQGKYGPPAKECDLVAADVTRALELEPSNASNHSDGALYLHAIARYREAQELMTRALELAPTNETIILNSRRVLLQFDEKESIERTLDVLAANPLSLQAGMDIDNRLWWRFQVLVAVPLWLAGVAATDVHLFFHTRDIGATRAGLVLISSVVIVSTVLYFMYSRHVLPARLVQTAISQHRLVLPALIVTAITSFVTLCAIAALLLGDLEPPVYQQPLYISAVTALAIAVFVQSLAAIAIAYTIARVDLTSMRYTDTPAGKAALARSGRSTGTGVMGIIGALVLVVISILSPATTSAYAILAIAVIAIGSAFAGFGVNTYRRSLAYHRLWLAYIWFAIAAAVYVLAGYVVVQQILGGAG
jgi:tetratricopeptide (TPR) repeat protein